MTEYSVIEARRLEFVIRDHEMEIQLRIKTIGIVPWQISLLGLY